jgi:hypothetical protein
MIILIIFLLLIESIIIVKNMSGQRTSETIVAEVHSFAFTILGENLDASTKRGTMGMYHCREHGCLQLERVLNWL